MSYHQDPLALAIHAAGVTQDEAVALAGAVTDTLNGLFSSAVSVLVRGPENPLGGASHGAARVAAAQEAHRILLAEGLAGSVIPAADRPHIR